MPAEKILVVDDERLVRWSLRQKCEEWGCYGIGIERILTAAIEQSNDENGFWLPPQIAPFEIIVTPTNVSDDKLLSTAVDIAQRLEAAGFDVLLDDRDERPGVKFKDADLVGIPFRVLP